jgi:integrase
MLFVQNLREPKAEVDPFELEEAERLINSATGQDRAIITVLIFCGLRPNEALALRWQDVDFGRRILKIRRTIHRFGESDCRRRRRVSATLTRSIQLSWSSRSSERARRCAASSFS